MRNSIITVVGVSRARPLRLCNEAFPDVVWSGLLSTVPCGWLGVTVSTTIANVVLVDLTPLGLVSTVSYGLVEVVTNGVVGVSIGVFGVSEGATFPVATGVFGVSTGVF